MSDVTICFGLFSVLVALLRVSAMHYAAFSACIL